MQGKTGAAHNRPRGDTGMAVREQKPESIHSTSAYTSAIHTVQQPQHAIRRHRTGSRCTETAADDRLTGLKIGIQRRKQ